MFYYIQNDENAKNLYNIFVTIYNNEEYKNLSIEELYKLVQNTYFEKYVKDNIYEEDALELEE